MKNKLILIVIGSLISFGSFSQMKDEDKDIHTRYRPGVAWFYSGFTPYEKEKLRKYDRLIVDLVYNDWHGDVKAFKSPWSSIGVNAAFMFDFVLTKGNTVALGAGLGYSHFSNTSKYEFQRDFEAKTTTIGEFSGENQPFRSKFGAHYLEIPVELRFRTKGYQHFKFMVGGKIGYQLSAMSKEKYKENGHKHTIKQIGFADANRLRYGVTARIGIRNWALFGAYYFSPLFKDSESVELYPFSIGVSVSLF